MTATVQANPRPRAARARLSGEAITVLVNAAGAGDQSAWNRLVQEFGSMIWAIARAHRLGDADAADVSQATWLALLEHITRLNNPAGSAPGSRPPLVASACGFCGAASGASFSAMTVPSPSHRSHRPATRC